MSGKRLYYGSVNNGVRSYFGEATEALLARKHDLAFNYGWDYAHAQIPNVGPIATFISEKTLSAWSLGYVTGTSEELNRWIAEYGITMLSSAFGNTVPFSNGKYVEEVSYSLSDDQFLELFGFDRPVDAISTPARRVPIEIAAALPSFAYWEEEGLRLPSFLSGVASFARPALGIS